MEMQDNVLLRKTYLPEDLSQIYSHASDLFTQVRDSMLEPFPRKVAPEFTTAQLSQICNLDKSRASYLIKRGDLPPGEVLGRGRTRKFSLKEAREWIAKVNTTYIKKPPGKKAVVITVCNFKGGCSKTTMAAGISQGFTLRNKKVLVVDLDPQASLTTFHGLAPHAEIDTGMTVMPLVFGDETSLEYAIQQSYWDGLDLIPSCQEVYGAEMWLPSKSMNGGYDFWSVINKGLEKARDDYDVIVIDTAPALSYMTINALFAADILLVPTPPVALDYASSIQFWSLFKDVFDNKLMIERSGKPKSFDYINILLSRVNMNSIGTSLVRDWIQKSYPGMLMPVEIPESSIVQTASSEFKTVYDYASWGGSNKSYERVRSAFDQCIDLLDGQVANIWNTQCKEGGAFIDKMKS